ncbi:MAG: four helix bundle protein [Peptococcaceae bacterium]
MSWLDKINFYYFARGSLCETRSHLLFVLKRGFITNDDYVVMKQQIDKIYHNINSIIKSLKTRTRL